MMSGDTFGQQLRLDDERAVEALQAESGFPGDPGLRQVLLQLRALRVTEPPEPSGELAALLAGPETADGARLEPSTPQRKQRMLFTALAVAASCGIAGGAAAGKYRR